jgi:hypothetical protein
MNVDPKSSKNYEKAIEKTKKMNQGRRFPVGDQRLTIKQISELTGKNTGNIHTALNTESADHYVNRVLKRKK